ncbi:MAG TPA: hypothetical protein VEX18_17675, partial [Polyangiaceae bacterium]|nr:hypothetical protein [Polyangiaceae bacterium]
MSEDKKPKIDLKARLGKKTVGAPAAGPGASIPPPAGIPKPSGVGIPAPPFQSTTATSRPAPMVDASNPYGASSPYGSMAPSVAPVMAAPSVIAVELSDEVVRAQGRGKTKIMVLALITAGIGGFIGFTLGGGAERAKGSDAAKAGAEELVKDVEKANAKIEELAGVLKSAKEKLGKAKFPDEELSKLGALSIPFDGTNLSGRGIGRFKSEVLNMLISFASASTEANDQKQKIQSVLNRNKKGVVEFLESQSKPVVRWSVIVGGSPLGPIASMQPVPTPFQLVGEQGKQHSWPEAYDLMEKDKKVSIKRYLKGEAASENPTFIPVDPSTQTLVCPNDVVFSIRRELTGMEEVLRGDPTPGEEKIGLLETGQNLLKKLKEIGKSPS